MITKPVPALLCAPTGHNPTSRTTPELATALADRGAGAPDRLRRGRPRRTVRRPRTRLLRARRRVARQGLRHRGTAALKRARSGVRLSTMPARRASGGMSRRCPGHTRWRRNNAVARAARRGGQPGPIRTPSAAATVSPRPWADAGSGTRPRSACFTGCRRASRAAPGGSRPSGRGATTRQARLCGGVRTSDGDGWSPDASGTVGAGLRRRWPARPWKRPQLKDEQCRPGLGRRGCRSVRQC